MASGTFHINANADDNEELKNWFDAWVFNEGAYRCGSVNTEAGYREALSAFRLYNVTIPKDATITTAYMTVYDDSASGSTTNIRLKVKVVAEDNCAQFTEGSPARDRSYLSAGVDWDFSPNWSLHQARNTPSLVSDIQAMVNRAGWSSGNYIGVVLRDDGTDNGHLHYVEAYKDSATYSADLYVEWVGFVERTKTITAKGVINRRVITCQAKANIFNVAYSYGWKVSKPNKSVFTSPPKDLIFSSGLSLLKIFAQGTINLSFGDGGEFATTELNHGLNYTPCFLVFMNTNQGNKVVADNGTTYWATIDNCRLEAHVDNTKLYLKGKRGTTTGVETKVVTYFLFADEA